MNDDDFARGRDLFLAGVAALEAGRLEEAQRSFTQSLALVPGRPSTLTNLGVARLQLGQPAQALPVLREAVQADPKQADAWAHLGTAYAATGDAQQALACFEQALALDAKLAPAWLRRSQVLQQLDRYEEALAACDKALALSPGHAPAWSHRGALLKDLGRLDDAAAAFEQALAHGGDPVLNQFFLVSLRGGEAPKAAPPGYVQTLFDNYAGEFDTHLVKTLRYSGHQRLAAEIEAAAPGRRFARALDLGCGTGLAGELVRPRVQVLEGVDLSQGMLDKAAQRGLYDRLTQAEVVDHLGKLEGQADLVLAADVFIYIGDLAPVFAGVQRVLAPGGLFAFSVERFDGPAAFELRTSQRYAHSPQHVRALAAQHGFTVRREAAAPVREDQRRPIDGLFLVLSK
jgi:predicted TPR repeat methyltransferase